jgi:hypothetical protein
MHFVSPPYMPHALAHHIFPDFKNRIFG